MKIILAIEDNKNDFLIYQKLLSKHKELKLLNADSFEASLTILQSEKIDCILLDNNLPSLSGLEILDFIKQYQINLPVILLTGCGNEDIAIQAMQRGVFNYLIKDKLTTDILAKAIFAAINKHQYELQNEKKSRINEKLAYYDQLTGLPNRALLNDRLNQAINTSRRNKSLLAVLFIDLDGFKLVNDNYGHQYGDKLLSETSLRFKRHIRETDTLARVGGDEFIIVLTDILSREAVENIASELITSLDDDFAIINRNINISCSIGIFVSDFFDENYTFDEVINLADKAMYDAKAIGKDSFVFFDKNISNKSLNLTNQMLALFTKGDVHLIEKIYKVAQDRKLVLFDIIFGNKEQKLLLSLHKRLVYHSSFCKELFQWYQGEVTKRITSKSQCCLNFRIDLLDLELNSPALRTLQELSKAVAVVIEITENTLISAEDKYIGKLRDTHHYAKLMLSNFGEKYASLQMLYKLNFRYLHLHPNLNPRIKEHLTKIHLSGNSISLVNLVK